MRKNIFRFLFVIALLTFAVILTGCEGTSQTQKGSATEIKEWVKETVGIYITEDMVLPTTHPTLGGEITWISTDSDVLNDDGSIVERGARAQEAELGFIVKLGDDIDSDYITVHVSPITLEEAVEKFEKNLQKKIVNGDTFYFVQRDIEIPTNFYGIITIECDSSNKDVFTNEGKYIKPLVDTEITFNVKFSDSTKSIDKVYAMNVMGKTLLEKIEEGADWLDANFVDMLLTAETGLPTQTDNGCTITWKSSNVDIVSEDGKVTESVFERYVSLIARLNLEGQFKTREYYCKVKALDTSNMTAEQKLDNYLKAIAVSSYSKVNFSSTADITKSYGFIYLFDGSTPEITEALLASNAPNKPNQNRTSTQFITVHDTANTSASADAAMHSRYINNGSGGASTSWHYSVGDTGIYYQVPDDEIAWHAGDGSRTYKLIDTGVKATLGMPLMTFSDDGYFVLGGQKTQIKVPDGTKNMITGPYGIYTEVGANGNYWMNNAYYNSSYGYICNSGGNRNTVSMETCVNTGSNYVKTFMNACYVTTKLLIKYNLSCDRIYQHNNFSGKNCPQVIRSADQWAQFRDLCAVMKYGFENYMDYNFEWTIKNTTQLSTDGLISLSCKKGDKVEYSVKVTKNNVIVANKSFVTILA